ncbi:hypothetical protein PN462_00060 [Spirulina sp. CS-785/01]|uniref:photosystem II assembly protein Psb35 n=1 Tax=Spirulina sp. CS-785/01 TaxID=3021716 RepID=UPI00232E9B89|nr:hypothetical protein [Spirulina sp. CS-785/01]MDB9311474.1 hypothetical protein [Spirulina sp. CS-785/01]
MHYLLQASSEAVHFPWTSTILYGLGFVLAVTLGSIAWYNSKRPTGWENKERPDIVPDIEK